MLIYSGSISALVDGEAMFSVNWPSRLECKLHCGGKAGIGPKSPMVWKEG